MREKHLTYFKVENFKRFESFEMNDIGQFNLILGDNNSGKTTVLEALLFDEDPSKLIRHYRHVLWSKGIKYQNGSDTNYFRYFYNSSKENELIFNYKLHGNSPEKKLSIKATTLSELSEPEIEIIKTQILQNQGKQNLVKMTSESSTVLDIQSSFTKAGTAYVPFIEYGRGYELDLLAFFSTVQQSTETLNTFKEDIKLLIPELVNVEVSLIQDLNNFQILIVREKGRDKPIPLTMYGEGTVKLFRILLEIIKSKGERLMIDEIDTGVHYSHFAEFWKTILKAAKRNDVQIFATTHNIECLKYLKECLEEPEMKEYQSLTNCFELKELPDKSIKAYNRNFEQFENAIDTNTNIRGGK